MVSGAPPVRRPVVRGEPLRPGRARTPVVRPEPTVVVPSSRLARVLPIIATVAAGLAALSALSWRAMDLDAGPPDLLAFAMFLVLLMAGIFLFVDRTPLGISMGAVQVLAALVGLLLFVGRVDWKSGGVQFSETFRLQYPPLAAMGVLSLVLMAVARHDRIEPRWNLWVTLGLGWLACAAFFLPDQSVDGNADAFAFVPAVLALAMVGLGVVHVREAE